jgi:hypothetical protein
MPSRSAAGSSPASFPRIRRTFVVAALAGLTGWLAATARGTDLDRPPINYATAAADNVVSRLQARLDRGQVKLAFDEKFGYLPALLRELNVPQSSQMLVFSKTSLQRNRIAPRTPRALYFSDDVYVGYCQRGKVLEVTAVDPQLGAVFYSLDQEPAAKPAFQRQGDSCLICHGSSQNQGIPGHLVRSVYADAEGYPVLSMGTLRVDQATPLGKRWGGWYVTGTAGKQAHLGNLLVQGRPQPEEIDNAENLNVTDLGKRFRTAAYLTPHSDIVALMVLEHQAELHNRISRANFQTRRALYEEADLNKALGRPAGARSDLTERRIQSACEPLVKYLLFSGEAKLTEPVKGTSGFAEEFVKRGPRDGKGRSLRELDLRTRLFRYPCSYLIYSEAFEGLPAAAKEYVLQRVWDVLSGADTSEAFAHLSEGDRRAVREILLATTKGLPDYWRAPAP